jgi:hypothetical protein
MSEEFLNLEQSVFELPGGWGVEPPSCLLNPPPKQDALGYPRGVSFNPPPLLMMLNCLCVMTMTMNRQMLRHAVKLSTPRTYFLTIQTLGTINLQILLN